MTSQCQSLISNCWIKSRFPKLYSRQISFSFELCNLLCDVSGKKSRISHHLDNFQFHNHPQGPRGCQAIFSGKSYFSHEVNFQYNDNCIFKFLRRVIWMEKFDAFSLRKRQSTQEVGKKQSSMSRVFPCTSFVLYRLLPALQQSRAQSRHLYLLKKTQKHHIFFRSE